MQYTLHIPLQCSPEYTYGTIFICTTHKFGYKPVTLSHILLVHPSPVLEIFSLSPYCPYADAHRETLVGSK